MKVIKNLYSTFVFIILIILRTFASGNWFGSIVVAGLFVTWMDTLNCVWNDNSKLNIAAKVRYGIIFTIMVVIGLILLALITVNFVIDIKWLNNTIVLDEITLLALLLCVSQKSFIKLLGNIIKKGKEWYKE